MPGHFVILVMTMELQGSHESTIPEVSSYSSLNSQSDRAVETRDDKLDALETSPKVQVTQEEQVAEQSSSDNIRVSSRDKMMNAIGFGLNALSVDLDDYLNSEVFDSDGVPPHMKQCAMELMRKLARVSGIELSINHRTAVFAQESATATESLDETKKFVGGSGDSANAWQVRGTNS